MGKNFFCVCFRVSEVLYPPIPRPPLKYTYFLEKNDSPHVRRTHMHARKYKHTNTHIMTCPIMTFVFPVLQSCPCSWADWGDHRGGRLGTKPWEDILKVIRGGHIKTEKSEFTPNRVHLNNYFFIAVCVNELNACICSAVKRNRHEKTILVWLWHCEDKVKTDLCVCWEQCRQEVWYIYLNLLLDSSWMDK